MKVKTELTFPGKLKEKPILCNLCKKFNITLSILEASFSTETGWAIIVLEGREDEIGKTFAYLRKEGVEIEDTQEIQLSYVVNNTGSRKIGDASTFVGGGQFDQLSLITPP